MKLKQLIAYFSLAVVLAVSVSCSSSQGQVVRDNSSSGSFKSPTPPPSDSLSRLSVTLLGEMVEPGFEAVFISMYDAKDRPAFFEGSMHIEFKDRLDDVLYSKLFTVGPGARWGPTLDGSEGAMLKIPLSDFTPGFPGEMQVSISFNGEKGSAEANHIEEYISLTAVPILEGDELTAKIDSLWEDAKSELDIQDFEVETEFFGDPFVMELQSFGCSYASGEFGNSESEMLRVDFDVLATGEGISEIYVPASFLDIGQGALVERDAFFGNPQMSVRGGATVTGSLFFDVGDCRLIDSAVFLLEDENGEFLIELDLFNPMATHRPTPIPAPVPTPTPSKNGDFKDAKTVAQSIDKQQITACQVQIYEAFGAKSGIQCKLAGDSKIEIYTFDGDAKSSCEESDWCRTIASDGSTELRVAREITFFDNVLLIADETEDIVTDIQDGTVSNSEINMVALVDDVSETDDSEVEELIRLAKNSNPIEIDIDDLIDLAETNALAADEYTYKLITTKGTVVGVDEDSIFATGLRRSLESIESGSGVWDGFHCVYLDNLKDSAIQLRQGDVISITGVITGWDTESGVGIIAESIGCEFEKVANSPETTFEPTPTPFRYQTEKIVFTADDGNDSEIYVMDPDGSNVVQLTNNGAHEHGARLSPDLSKITYWSSVTGSDEIYVMNADGSSITRITNNSVQEGYPAWSPDSKKIVYSSRTDGNMAIHIMNADGSNQTLISNTFADETEPVWSPDGNKIAFSSKRDGDRAIYVMNTDGSSQTRLSPDHFSHGGRPSWSPDGTKILFDGPNGYLWVMEANGSNHHLLSKEGGIQGSWSPDGDRIVFSHGSILMMDSDGSNREKLTAFYASSPDWIGPSSETSLPPIPTPTAKPTPTPTPKPTATPTEYSLNICEGVGNQKPSSYQTCEAIDEITSDLTWAYFEATAWPNLEEGKYSVELLGPKEIPDLSTSLISANTFRIFDEPVKFSVAGSYTLNLYRDGTLISSKVFAVKLPPTPTPTPTPTPAPLVYSLEVCNATVSQLVAKNYPSCNQVTNPTKTVTHAYFEAYAHPNLGEYNYSADITGPTKTSPLTLSQTNDSTLQMATQTGKATMFSSFGSYTLNLYRDGSLISSKNFTVQPFSWDDDWPQYNELTVSIYNQMLLDENTYIGQYYRISGEVASIIGYDVQASSDLYVNQYELTKNSQLMVVYGDIEKFPKVNVPNGIDIVGKFTGISWVDGDRPTFNIYEMRQTY